MCVWAVELDAERGGGHCDQGMVLRSQLSGSKPDSTNDPSYTQIAKEACLKGFGNLFFDNSKELSQRFP
ncbi:hypothetical protein AVEN_100352-1 [Araneus ventricosus]|uniref:Uncharacterized protein n=1 Tax=Araneus ventricosus TaxID=182803 RepID=A0A4Y2KPW3_ARAVE|nr:hypothetical protein AVEN_100352-1 [Araneus ventricosus]